MSTQRKSKLPKNPQLVSTDEATNPFIGKWNQLISQTNWEKGAIICEWREALITQGAEASEYADEAWAELVGGVTGQHVGRLRRVYLRFHESYESFEGLYWSHFFAALDWSDAEMWLEGALQNDWSVSQMRAKRWETLGSPEDLKPSDDEIISSETNEDFSTPVGAEPEGEALTAVQSGKETASERVKEPSEESEDDEVSAYEDSEEQPASYSSTTSEPSPPGVKPFANLPKLPEDIDLAFEQFKVAILTHKLLEWQEVSCDDVITALNALKAFALAPSGND